MPKKKPLFKLFYATERGGGNVHHSLAGKEFKPKAGDDEYYVDAEGRVFQMETEGGCCEDEQEYTYMAQQYHLIAKIVK